MFEPYLSKYRNYYKRNPDFDKNRCYTKLEPYKNKDTCLKIDMTNEEDRKKISPSARTYISSSNEIIYYDVGGTFEYLKCESDDKFMSFKKLDYYYPTNIPSESSEKIVRVSKLSDFYSKNQMALIYILISIIAAIVIIIGSCSAINDNSKSQWDSLSEDEKAWYERNYGNGKSEAYNKAIEDYNNKYNSY